LLRASDAGRAVFVTTGLARVDRPYFGPYAASKAALERMAQDYAREVEITPVRVNLFDPGILRTRMRAAAYPGEDPLTVQTPESVAPALAALCLPGESRNGTIITH
jgi:NAD(P)-dependent dehydrogenase (short-subunit alcohol dehydrogenase family)